ncbi:MAG: Nre family DNA repair protein [Sulfolobales archaeon]
MGYLLGGFGKEISSSLCVRCKGYKMLCGLPRCPLIVRLRAQAKVYVKIVGRDVEGSTPPSGVVGEKDYPVVPVLIGIPPGVIGDEASIYDSPEKWWGVKSLEDIIELRSSVVAALIKADVRNYQRLIDLEIPFAMVSSKPVDTEASLARAPTPVKTLDPIITPHGLLAVADRVRVNSNPSIPRSVEKIYGDELRASEAIWELYMGGVSIYTIQRALSFGLLGLPRNRRLVPTRWAITAVDSVISSKLLRSIRTYSSVNDIELYRGEYLGNRFWVIIQPGPYSFEWIEIWHPNTIFTEGGREPIVIRNREGFSGEPLFMDGGYHAARLAVLEHLYRRGRRASIIVVREITPRYYASVGNWHIRETVRRILEKSPEKVSTISEAISTVESELLANMIRLGDKARGRQQTLDRYLGPK